MNMDLYEFKLKVEKYTKEAIKKLEEVKKIADIEEQCNEIDFAVRKHKQSLEELKQGKPKDFYDRYYPYNLEKYEKKVKELKDYWGEVAEKSNKIREQKKTEERKRENEQKRTCCAYCKKRPPTGHYIYSKKNKTLKLRKRDVSLFDEWLFCSEEHFEKWHKKNYYCCAECLEEVYQKKYWYGEKENDNKKFCSNQCCNLYYAETCDKCQQKALGNTYYQDGINKIGTLCSKCYGKERVENRRESERIRKDLEKDLENFRNSNQEEEEEESVIYCRYCSAKTDSIFDVCNQDSCLEKMNQEIEDKKDNNNPITVRERERERETNLLQYFTTKNIHSVRLENDKLFIKYIHKAEEEEEEEEEEPNTTELEQIRDYLDSIPEKSITKSELESKNRQNSSSNGNGDKNSNLGLYIGLGVVGIGLIFIIIFLRKNRKKRIEEV